MSKSKKPKYVIVKATGENYFDIVSERDVAGREVVVELSTSFRKSIGIAIHDYGYHPCTIDCLAKKWPELCS